MESSAFSRVPSEHSLVVKASLRFNSTNFRYALSVDTERLCFVRHVDLKEIS